jgi:aspartate aminotransferase
MPGLTKLAERISKSPTVVLTDKAKQLAQQGYDVIALAGGEPDFDTPAHIVDAAISAIHAGETHYAAPSKGLVPLLEAIADKTHRENNYSVNPMTDVIVTPGGKFSLFLALKSILNPTDEVLILAPYWVSYPSMVAMVGANPVVVPLSSADNYTIHLEQLREYVTPNTKAIIVNSPNNPSGRVLTQAEADAITTLALESDLWVIADEIYEKITYDQRQHLALASIPELTDRTLTINGVSKGHAMTGWRLGWLVGPKRVLDIATIFNSQTVTSTATFTMHAATAALTGPQDIIETMRQSYEDRRDFIVEAFNSIDNFYCPQIEGAFYAFPQVKNTDKSSEEIANLILNEAQVVGVPGSAFGITESVHIRFSYATHQSLLEQAIDRIRKIAHLL